MRNVFDSADVPGHERVEAWRHAAGDALVPTEFHIAEPSAFTARIDAMSLGIAQITAMSYTSLSSLRTHGLIRRSDPELYQVGLVRCPRRGWPG